MAQSEPSATDFQFVQIEIDKINKSDNQVKWWQFRSSAEFLVTILPHCFNSACAVHLAEHCIFVNNTDISRPPSP